MKKSLCLLLALCFLTGCGGTGPESGEARYCVGFGSAVLPVPTDSEELLYIAGYHGGWEITGVLDQQQARAIWLDDGKNAVLLIVIDCIGLGNGTVEQIRQELSDFCRETGCDSVNVISTHTHAGVDTMGLWGPTALDGKNEAFMQNLLDGAVAAARAAYEDRSVGTLSYSVTPTQGLQADSREPVVFDSDLYQLRFVPENGQKNGIRLISFAAHAEALRGDNTLVSRDYPGVICDRIKEETGENAVYLPGAIGGLIMTPELTGDAFDAEENLVLTGEAIANAAVSAEEWRELSPVISISRVEFETELENTLFLYYKFLGILEHSVRRDLAGTYWLKTELTVLRLGNVTLALLPGEVFPELVSGTGKEEDPKPLSDIAAQYGVEELIVVGLANDEIGYILPPSDYLLDEERPYFREAEGDHYEETNSVGKNCAHALAEAFEKALQ